jgi:lipid-binding SYLF domain-containing protein
MIAVRMTVVCAALVLAVSGTSVAQDDATRRTIEVFRQSDVVKPFFEDAYGYAVFPRVGQAGFVVGGAFGNGTVFVAGEVTGTARMIKASIGFQAGGQAFSQMIFFQDKRAYDEFTSGSFEFGAGVSVVAITAGAQASAGTQGTTAGATAGPATGVQAQAEYRRGMAVFVHALGGLMYEATVAGQRFTFQPKT